MKKVVMLIFLMCSLQAMEEEKSDSDQFAEIAQYICEQKIIKITDKKEMKVVLEYAALRFPEWKKDLFQAYGVDDQNRFIQVQGTLDQVMSQNGRVISWVERELWDGLIGYAQILGAMPPEFWICMLCSSIGKKR